MTHLDRYTEGGAPSNGQVASVKVSTIDLSTLAAGPTTIGDIINLFDLDATEQTLQGGYEVIEAADAAVVLDIGLDGGSTFGAAEVASSVLAPTDLDTVPAPGTSGVVTIEVNGAAATKGKIKVWLVVASFLDPTTVTTVDTPAP